MREYLNEKASALQEGAIRAMFDRAAGRKNMINLGIGEPDVTTHPDIIEAAHRALLDGYTHYTPNAGLPGLRSAVAAIPRYAAAGYDPASEIIVTTGGMGALFLLFQVILTAGDEVLVQDPSWLNYASIIRWAGGRPVSVRTAAEDDFALKADALAAAVTPKTRAILLNSPSNPTGSVIPASELEKIAALAEERDLLVISDEVYCTLVYDGAEAPTVSALPGMRRRAVVVNSFSKSFAMTGWRVGWAAGPAAIIGKMTRLQENANACAPAVSQEAARYALSRSDISRALTAEFAEKRAVLLDGLAKVPGLSPVKPQGAFYAFPDVRTLGLSSEELCSRLLDATGVVCIPGAAFGAAGEGCVRMCYANSKENLAEAMRRFTAFAAKL